MTFDDVSAGSNDVISGTATSGGFAFTSAHWHVIDVYTNFASDGTQYAALDSPSLALPLTMTKSGGGTFSLNSFDGGELFVAPPSGFPNADLIRVVGSLSGGGTVSQDFTLDGIIDSVGGADDFQHFAFGAGWNDLTSVVWDGFLVTGSRASISIDNIVADAGVTVPLPSSALLGLSFLAGLGLVARRRRLALQA